MGHEEDGINGVNYEARITLLEDLTKGNESEDG